MSKCSWILTPKSGGMKGIDICTLTGRPCVIDEGTTMAEVDRARAKCTRAAEIAAFQAKHYPPAKPDGARVEPKQGMLL